MNMMADHSHQWVDNNWGLQAIFGGSSSDDFGADSCYGLFEVPKDDADEYNCVDLAMLTDELEQLYKPFYPADSSASAERENFVIPNPISIPKATKEEPQEIDHQEKQQTVNDLSTVTTPTLSHYVPKYKRRKNQQKRVVLQATAEDLSSDMWAWRKYGQKPIKGSPYPRSYYRCSSSKGCFARKQVEQSCSDPSIFIITYTAEHSHSQPTRKNALAGTVRHKFLTSNTSKNAATKPNKHHLAASSSSTSSTADVEDIESPDKKTRNIKQEIKKDFVVEEEINIGDHQQMVDEHSNVDMIKLEDDFFSGLEDLDGLILKLANGRYYELL